MGTIHERLPHGGRYYVKGQDNMENVGTGKYLDMRVMGA